MAVATKLKFVWCFQCIIWWQLLGKWNQLLYLCEKNKQINCFKHFSCHKMMYLFVQLLHIETGWVIKGVNSESGKIQTPESRSSKFKLNHARIFFKGVHQCQTDIVQEAGLFAPSLASFDETIETFWKCQLPCLSPVPVLCAINVFKRQFLLWFCKIRRLVLVFLPGSWICLCSFAEIEDIGVAPDGARRTPASFILRPGCLRLQAGSIAVALAGGVVAVSLCCLLLAHCLLWWQGRCYWRRGRRMLRCLACLMRSKQIRFAFNLWQICAKPHSRGGEGHQIWIIFNMLCSTFKRLYYVLNWLSEQLYNMSYNQVCNNFYMLNTTFVT